MVLPKITHLWGLKVTYNTVMPKSQHKNISTAVQLFVTKVCKTNSHEKSLPVFPK